MADKDYDSTYDWDDAVGGGLLDSYVGTVTSSEFGIDEDYRPDTIRAMWTIELVEQDDPDVELEPGDEINEAYNVGNDSTWELLEGGKAVGKIDGKRAKFNNNSAFGRIVAAASKGAHYGDEEKTRLEGADKLLELLRERGPGTVADIWEGLTFRFERLDFSFFSKEDDEEVEYQRVCPTEFIGEAGAKSSGKKSSKASSKKAAKEKSSDDDGPTRADLLALAAEHEDFSKFLATAMSQYPGVEDGDLAKDLLDKDGIHAEAHS